MLQSKTSWRRMGLGLKPFITAESNRKLADQRLRECTSSVLRMLPGSNLASYQWQMGCIAWANRIHRPHRRHVGLGSSWGVLPDQSVDVVHSELRGCSNVRNASCLGTSCIQLGKGRWWNYLISTAFSAVCQSHKREIVKNTTISTIT